MKVERFSGWNQYIKYRVTDSEEPFCDGYYYYNSIDKTISNANLISLCEFNTKKPRRGEQEYDFLLNKYRICNIYKKIAKEIKKLNEASI